MGDYADRIALCMAPDGPHEHVDLKPGEPAPRTCFADCECKPEVYVPLSRAEAAEAKVEKLREALRELLPWADTYEDNMGLGDFARRDQAITNARARLDENGEDE